MFQVSNRRFQTIKERIVLLLNINWKEYRAKVGKSEKLILYKLDIPLFQAWKLLFVTWNVFFNVAWESSTLEVVVLPKRRTALVQAATNLSWKESHCSMKLRAKGRAPCLIWNEAHALKNASYWGAKQGLVQSPMKVWSSTSSPHNRFFFSYIQGCIFGYVR